jgi:hypothetical protein
MVFPPIQVSDYLNNAISGSGNNDNQLTPNVPGTSGIGTRQASIANNRDAVSTRHLVHWFLPEGPIVQMYINPQSIRIGNKKAISPTRTKGGYVLQYWGEELTTLSIQGTTGSSGIEGINVLHDVYRNEQLAFDPYALYMSAKFDQDNMGAGLFEDTSVGEVLDFASSVVNSADANISSAMNAPSLAALAFTVEMHWSGESYRGYFSGFDVTEDVNNLGMFTYSLEFVCTRRSGYRNNYLPFHRSAVSGPSNSSPQFGVPYSYGNLFSSETYTPRR